jgi:pregnancy-associated plasma protein-A
MKRTLAAVVTAALIGSGVAAAPATAGVPSAVSGLTCAPGTTVSQAFGGLAEHATARGPRESAARALVGDSEIPAGQEPSTSPSFTATIPVYFHVLAKSTRAKDGWVSDAQIRDQIDVLNAAFAGQYGGAATGFRFVLKGITRTVNARWHDMATFQDELEAKRALKVGDAKTLNIYSTSVSLGFAYYPKIVAGGYGGFQDADGVVIHFGSMPGGHIKNFNLGHTATHEAGHYLGLPHTFEQGCQGHGDYVDDTPAMSVPTSGCPAGKDTCPEPGEDPIHNFMDYSFDSCYTEFTPGQATRMQQQYLHWRVKHGYSPPQT